MELVQREVLTAPASEPVSLSEAVTACRLVFGQDNEAVAALIPSARQNAEKLAARSFTAKNERHTGRLSEREACTGAIRLPIPVDSIISVSTVDPATLEATAIDPGDVSHVPAMQSIKIPAPYAHPLSVVIDAVMAPPVEMADAKTGMLLMISEMYHATLPENGSIPKAVLHYLKPYDLSRYL